MSATTRRTRDVLLPCAAACLLLAAAGSALAAEAPVAVRVDYLPNLIYDGECLSLCGAVVNRTSGGARARITCALSAEDGPDLGTRTRELTVPAGDEARFELSWRLVHLGTPVTLALSLTVGDRTSSRPPVVIHPASLDMPELTVAKNHLVDDERRRVVLVVRRQARERESRWAVLRWAKSVIAGDKIDPASGLLVGDLLAEDEKQSYVARLKASGVMGEFDFLPVRHPAEADRAACAVLRTVAAFSRSALDRRYDAVLFFLGSEEARFGTDVEEFRKAVDLMSGLARKRGTQVVGFVQPAAPPRLARRTAAYRAAMDAVAYVSRATVADPQPAVRDAGWGSGRHAGAAAHGAIADTIIELVKATTRR